MPAMPVIRVTALKTLELARMVPLIEPFALNVMTIFLVVGGLPVVSVVKVMLKDELATPVKIAESGSAMA